MNKSPKDSPRSSLEEGQAHEWPDLAEVFRSLSPGLSGAIRGILGRGADVEELLQEVFLKVWRRQPHTPPPKDLKAWIFVITLNTARDARRARDRRPPALSLEKVDDMKSLPENERPDSQVVARESLEKLRDAVHELDEPVREVFLLKTSASLTYEAIAENLGIPIGTAKTRMRHALSDLRRVLAEPSGPHGGVIHEA